MVGLRSAVLSWPVIVAPPWVGVPGPGLLVGSRWAFSGRNAVARTAMGTRVGTVVRNVGAQQGSYRRCCRAVPCKCQPGMAGSLTRQLNMTGSNLKLWCFLFQFLRYIWQMAYIPGHNVAGDADKLH